jgi:hypothetical protein
LELVKPSPAGSGMISVSLPPSPTQNISSSTPTCTI